MLLMLTRLSILVTPSQCRTSGMRTWKRMSALRERVGSQPPISEVLALEGQTSCGGRRSSKARCEMLREEAESKGHAPLTPAMSSVRRK